jgi:hypothetical protein
MTTTKTLRQFRILPMGGAKARTNDNSGGDDTELNQKPYKAG